MKAFLFFLLEEEREPPVTPAARNWLADIQRRLLHEMVTTVKRELKEPGRLLSSQKSMGLMLVPLLTQSRRQSSTAADGRARAAF